jgi:hypothetical protein
MCTEVEAAETGNRTVRRTSYKNLSLNTIGRDWENGSFRTDFIPTNSSAMSLHFSSHQWRRLRSGGSFFQASPHKKVQKTLSQQKRLDVVVYDSYPTYCRKHKWGDCSAGNSCRK